MGSQRVGHDWVTELNWFTLIHGPNILGSYAVLFFTASDFTYITSHIQTGHCFHFGSISSFFLELFFHSCPVAYWAPTDQGSTSFSVISFCIAYCSWGSQGKSTEVVSIPFSSGPRFVRTLHHEECYCTIALISHSSKVMVKFSKWGFNSTLTENFQMLELDLEKTEEPETRLPTSVGP